MKQSPLPPKVTYSYSRDQDRNVCGASESTLPHHVKKQKSKTHNEDENYSLDITSEITDYLIFIKFILRLLYK